MSLFNATTSPLPSGATYIVSGQYDTTSARAVTFIVIAAALSCLSVAFLLILFALSLLPRFRAWDRTGFLRSCGAPYFISLLFCNLWHAIGALLDIHWVQQRRVHTGASCTVQAALESGGTIGAALWSLVIASHAFVVFVLGRRTWEAGIYITLVVVWSLTGFLVALGPAVLEKSSSRGPFFGVSTLWCSITDHYSVEKALLEHPWMFLSGIATFVNYTVILVKSRDSTKRRPRSFLLLEGSFAFRPKGWTCLTAGPDEAARRSLRQIMKFPLVFFLTAFPLAVCQFVRWSGRDVSSSTTVALEILFGLQGFLNVTIFCTASRVNLFNYQRHRREDAERAARAAARDNLTPFTASSSTPSTVSSQLPPTPIRTPMREKLPLPWAVDGKDKQVPRRPQRDDDGPSTSALRDSARRDSALSMVPTEIHQIIDQFSSSLSRSGTVKSVETAMPSSSGGPSRMPSVRKPVQPASHVPPRSALRPSAKMASRLRIVNETEEEDAKSLAGPSNRPAVASHAPQRSHSAHSSSSSSASFYSTDSRPPLARSIPSGPSTTHPDPFEARSPQSATSTSSRPLPLPPQPRSPSTYPSFDVLLSPSTSRRRESLASEAQSQSPSRQRSLVGDGKMKLSVTIPEESRPLPFSVPSTARPPSSDVGVYSNVTLKTLYLAPPRVSLLRAEPHGLKRNQSIRSPSPFGTSTVPATGPMYF